MKTKTMKLTGILLTLVMIVAMLGMFSMTASAAEAISYVDAKGTDMGTVNATKIESGTTTWSNGWYYVTGSVTISSRVTVSGTVHLILADGATLTAKSGIKVHSENTLIIWGQSSGTGKLVATGGYEQAGIGGDIRKDAGTITINGGVIVATGETHSAGIGGGGDGGWSNQYGGKAGTVTINGGNVTATGGSSGAGIGACADVWGGNIKITGGVINASTLGGTSAGYGMAIINVSGCPVITCAGYINGKSSGQSWEATWTSGILFTSTDQYASGSVFGNPTLNQNVTIPGGKTLNIPSGSTLTIPEGYTFKVGDYGYLNNDGKIVNNGTLSVWHLNNKTSGQIENSGTFQGNSTNASYKFENNGTITNKETGVIKSVQPLSGTGSITTNGIKFELTGLTANPDTRTLTHNNTDYTVTLSLTDGENYVLPKSVTVTVGGETLAASNYTYNSTTGELTIPAAQIKGNVVVKAAAATPYNLWVGGVQLTSDNLTIDSEDIEGVTGSATYEPITNTLTLNSFTYTGAGYNWTDSDKSYYAAIYYGGSVKLNLVLTGESNVTQSSDDPNRSYGIFSADEVELTGSGTLRSVGADAEASSFGMRVQDKLIISDDITLTGIGGCAGYESIGISANNIQISAGYLKGVGGTCIYDNSYDYSYGVYSGEDITVSDTGILEGEGGEGYYSYGVFANDDMFVSGGKLVGTGGLSSCDFISRGVGVNDDLTVTGGTLMGIGIDEDYGEGLYVDSLMDISDGVIIATGGEKALNKAPAVASSYATARVWYGDTEDAANTAGSKPVSDLATAYNSKYVRIADVIEEAEADIKALEEAVAALEQAKTELQEAIDSKADAATVKAKLAELEARIKALEDVKDAYKDADATLKATLEAAIATAKSEAIESAETLVNNAKTELQAAIDEKADTVTLNEKVAELNKAIETAEATAKAYADTQDEALKKELEAAIEKAKNEAIASAETLVNNAKTELQAAIDEKADTATLTAKVEELNAAIETAEATAKAYADTQDEALKKELEAAIEKAKNEAIASAETLVNNAKTELQAAIDEKADTATLNEKVDELNKAIATAEATAKAYADAQDEALKKALEQALANAESTLREAISGVQSDLDSTKAKLDQAIADLNKAIADGDADLSAKIAALNEALASAKAALEAADAANKADLESQISNARSSLRASINKVQRNLDEAVAALEQAIADGDTDLSSKIIALNTALDNAISAYQAADSSLKSELTAKIDEADAALQAAINALASELGSVKQALEAKDAELAQADADNKAALEAKDAELQTFIIIVCVISGLSFCGCGTIAVFYVIDKRKKTSL